jgi:branched-subunit amino acid transport protein
MTYSTTEIWALIGAIGIGTYVIRFSFLGLVGSRAMPDWAMRLLRYAPVAVLPGLVAPAVMWPDGDAAMDPARLVAAAVTVLIGWRSGNLVAAIFAGGGTFALLSL